MPSPKPNCILVRHKKTGKIDVRRANEFARYTTSSNLSDSLHYVGSDRTRVCRCTDLNHHYQQIVTVASKSTHLNASLMLYMSRKGLKSCTIARFESYQNHRQAVWRKEGVDTNTFHYMNHEKTIVCRCLEPRDHNAGIVRNFEIIDGCAEFFVSHQKAMTCTKEQWQRVEGDLPPVYSPPVTSPHHQQSMRSPVSHQDSFRYDSQSTQKLRRKHAIRESASSDSKVCSVVRPVALPSSQRPPSGPSGEPDIPAEVWRNSGLSVWVPPRESASITTTPLGSAFPQHLVPFAPAAQQIFSEPFGGSQQFSLRTYQTSGQQGTGVRDEDWYQNAPGDNSQLGINGQPPGTPQQTVVPSKITPKEASQPSTELHELPAQLIAEHPGNATVAKTTVEPQLHMQLHSATLTCLEGLDTDTIPELPGKQSTRESQSFEQVHRNISQPGQREYLLHHAVSFSQVNGSLGGKCALCNRSRKEDRKRLIILPECKHLLHEHCLLADFRLRDQKVGRCPVCDVGLCSRTIMDRIDSDRIAVFGSQFTRLRCEVSVELPQHNESVKCASEEEVAAAQLRLIKDYVDVHTEEVFRRWELNRAEPDWFMGIVQPSIKLFQAWNAPDRHNQYFLDQEAFLRLLAWAELVRLMELGRQELHATQGKFAAFPQLSELHAKFTMARERYNQAKLLWTTDESAVLAFDRIMQETVNIGMRIRSC